MNRSSIPQRGSRSLAPARADCQSGKEGKTLKKPAVNHDSQCGSEAVSRAAGSARTAELEAPLANLRDAGLYRTLRRVEGVQGPRMRVDGRDVLMLAGANYLDLAGDARVVAGARSALEAYGAAAGGARLISGNLPIHEQLEQQLAELVAQPTALLFSTGYMANLGVVTSLCGSDDHVVSDALNHASIIDACRLSGAHVHVFRHNDPEDFERVARTLPVRGRRLLIMDGVYSMDGDIAKLSELAPIARRYGFWVVLDDAHGIGALGEHGRGVAELEAVSVDVLIGNLGKAFGSFGAFVACDRTLREWLINRARSFIFTCALAPAAAGAALAAVDIVRSEPQRRRRLIERATRLRDGLRAAGIDTGMCRTQIVPLIVGASDLAMRLCERALERGIYAQGIRHPSVPEGSARLRLTPTCAHTAADIDLCISALTELAKDLPYLPRPACRGASAEWSAS